MGTVGTIMSDVIGAAAAVDAVTGAVQYNTERRQSHRLGPCITAALYVRQSSSVVVHRARRLCRCSPHQGRLRYDRSDVRVS